jgi:predicted RNase H-like nuclease
MFFIGIDLAWSTKNGTGISVVKGGKEKAEVVYSGIAYPDDDIMRIINSIVGEDDALVAIDAPLIVPNESGRRKAEEIVGKFFRKYNAGAHPANRKRLSSWTGTIRGEEISKILEKNGFVHDPVLERFEKSRKFFEVYPHPSMVVLFNLDLILRYKSKPGRNHEFLEKMFGLYQHHLRDLGRARPSLKISKGILEKDVKNLRGKKLKAYEDILDSIFCAYIAYYAWANPEKCAVLGSMREGYIMTPVFESMLRELKSLESQKKLL